VTFALWAVQTTALDPGPLHHDAREVLDNPPVEHAMATRVAEAISTSIPSGVAADPNTIDIVAARAIQQPEFVAAFGSALDQVQAHVVRGVAGPITLDPTLVSQAVRAAGTDQPELASTLASGNPLIVQVPDDQVPDLARWADLWHAAVRALALFSLLLLAYGLFRIEHRVWAIGKIGRWAIALGVGTLAVFWLLPRALLDPLGGWIAVGGVVLGAGDVLVPISLALIGLGIVAVVSAHRWETHDRRRVLSVIPQAATRSTRSPSPWESPV
jgi:hypothetical protein